MINSNTHSQTGTWKQKQSPVGCDCYRTIHTKFKTKFQFFFMPIFGAMAIAPYGFLSLSASFYFMRILFNGALGNAPYKHYNLTSFLGLLFFNVKITPYEKWSV